MAKRLLFLSPEALQDLRQMRADLNGLLTARKPTPPGQARPLDCWVLLTSATTTAGRYPGKIWQRDEAGATWIEGETCWIDSPNGATLATGTYYRGTVTHASIDPGGDARPVVQIIGGGGVGGTITVQEQDGSPSLTNIHTVQADQAAGFVVTLPAAGKALLSQQAATAGLVGYVSIGTQDFGGLKDFNDGLRAVYLEAYPVGSVSDYPRARLNYVTTTPSAGAELTSQDEDGTNFPTCYWQSIIPDGSQDGGAYLATFRNDGLGGTPWKLPRYGISAAGTLTWGLYTTLFDGSVFKGGILTSAGSNFTYANSTLKAGAGYFGNANATSAPTLSANEAAGPYFN